MKIDLYFKSTYFIYYLIGSDLLYFKLCFDGWFRYCVLLYFSFFVCVNKLLELIVICI